MTGALSWTCSGANVYHPLNCDDITVGLGADASAAARADLVFDAYWNAAGRVDYGCCFGNSDGVSKCLAAVTSECDDNEVSVEEPPLPPPSPPPQSGFDPNVDLVIFEGETLTIRSSPAVQNPRAIVVFGKLVIESHVHLR